MRSLDTVMALALVALIPLWFFWAVRRQAWAFGVLKRGGPALQIRALIAALVWVAVSTFLYSFGVKNYFVLGEAASVLALFRAVPHREIGKIGIFLGAFMICGRVIGTLFWFPQFSLAEVLLLDYRIGAIFDGSLAFWYAVFVCSALSYIWGRATGLPVQTHRNGAPFTVESEVPEHVIHLRRAP